jgi:hypothetical protein
MATLLTKLEVFNLALAVIKEPRAQSIEVDSAPMRWLHTNYDHEVDSALRSYVWNFAKKRYQISEEPTGPEFGFSRRYKVPNGALRVLPIHYNGDRNRPLIPHEIVGNFIETDERGPLKVTVIRRVDNPGEWDNLFAEIVRCRLALGMANKFTGKNKFIELADSMLRRATEKAEEIDTFEGSAVPTEQHDIIRVRG